MRADSRRKVIGQQVLCLLREERERQGISAYLLAQRAGLSQSMVSLLERHLRNPTLDTLLRLADALGVNLDEVLRRARLAASADRPG